GDKISVIAMKHRPLHNRRREVGISATIGEELRIKGNDTTIRLERSAEMNFKRITLSRHDHVIVFGQNDSRRTSGPMSDHGGISSDRCRLRFLTTKTTAQALCNADHIFKRQAKRFSHEMLRLGRMLRR